MHLFCTLYYKRISLWKLHGLWKLQFKNCFCIDRFAVLGPQECLEFVCRILLDCSFSGRTLLRVWIDLCDYWTVPFSGENFASCLDRFVRLLTAVPFSGENFTSYLDRFVRLLTTIWFSGENFASYYLDRFVIIIDNYFVLRENIASWFALNFV